MPVGESIVRDHPLDAGDAVGGEVGGGAGEEPVCGGAFLVGVDLGVGKAGVVIDGGVDVVEPDGGLGVPGVRGALVDPPAATVGYATELLHVDMDQIAGMGVLVPDLGRA